MHLSNDALASEHPASVDAPPFLDTNFVKQSTPKHVAIIMDGNRRWARSRELPAAIGHRRGLERVEALLPAVQDTDIECLTLFGFAAANWQRSRAEVDHLFKLAERALRRFLPRCEAQGLAIRVIGRRDRLPRGLIQAIEHAECATRCGSRLLQIALDYSAREAILAAARRVDDADDLADFTAGLATGGEVDLLIRTGCEQRLSDFLLWECAFAELYFPDIYWPDFSASCLCEALDWYQQRSRRFGR